MPSIHIYDLCVSITPDSSLQEAIAYAKARTDCCVKIKDALTKIPDLHLTKDQITIKFFESLPGGDTNKIESFVLDLFDYPERNEVVLKKIGAGITEAIYDVVKNSEPVQITSIINVIENCKGRYTFRVNEVIEFK